MRDVDWIAAMKEAKREGDLMSAALFLPLLVQARKPRLKLMIKSSRPIWRSLGPGGTQGPTRQYSAQSGVRV
jgi:hypothetical protein